MNGTHGDPVWIYFYVDPSFASWVKKGSSALFTAELNFVTLCLTIFK